MNSLSLPVGGAASAALHALSTRRSPGLQPLPWPSLGELLIHLKTRPANCGRVLRIGAAMAWSRFYRRDFEWQVSPLSLAGPLLRQRGAGGFAPLYQAFVDQRHGMRERFRQYHHNLVAAETWLAGAKDALLADGRHVLLRHGDFSIDLGLNEISLQEGLWSLSLRDAEGRRLSMLTFCFVRGGGLLVGSVQGPRMDDAEALAGIRAATQAFEGLRPPYLLLTVLRLLGRQWALPVAGIDPSLKVGARRRHRGSPHAFDYLGFWESNGAERQPDGRWTLPDEVGVRDLSTVPSKKRAMYRRRGEWLDQAVEELRRVLPSPQR